MKVNRQTQSHTIRLKPHRRHSYVLRINQPEAPELTHAQKVAMRDLLIERTFKPVLQGKVDIREVLTPPGGWARLEVRHPNLRSLPIDRQLMLALHG